MCRPGCTRMAVSTDLSVYKPDPAPGPNLTSLFPRGSWPPLVTDAGNMLCGSSLKVCAACLIAWEPGHTWPTAQRISERWHRSVCTSCLAISFWRTHR